MHAFDATREAVTPNDATTRRAQRFAHAASVLAEEASRVALANLGPGHDVDVAHRAAGQAREAASRLGEMSSEHVTMDTVLQTATWAMVAAAVALGQADVSQRAACGPSGSPR